MFIAANFLHNVIVFMETFLVDTCKYSKCVARDKEYIHIEWYVPKRINQKRKLRSNMRHVGVDKWN